MFKRQRRFYYQGQTLSGETTTGIIEQQSEELARTELLHQGIRQVRFRPPVRWRWPRSITRRDCHDLTRQLSTLLQAQLPLLHILNVLSRNLKHPGWTPVLTHIRQDIQQGLSLADAFRAFPQYFDPLFCNLIAAGEQSSALASVCARLVEHQNRTEHLRQQLRTVLRYPLIVLSIAFGLSLLLLTQVIPTFADLFLGFGNELPPLTARLIEWSETLHRLSGLALSIGLSAVVAVIFTLRRWRAPWRTLSFYCPGFGALQRTAALALLSHTLAVSLKAGIPLLQSVQIAINASQHPQLMRQHSTLLASLSAGNPLHQVLMQTKACPELLIEMIHIGEQTGTLESILDRAGTLFDEQLEQQIKAASAWVEPVVMLLLAGLIGGLLLGLYLPVFAMGNLL